MTAKVLRVGFLIAACALASCTAETDPSTIELSYPEARRVDRVDDYHGVEVADPYRWLEDLDGAETGEWIEAQNALSAAYLDAIPRRANIESRLTELWNYERFSTPSKEGGRYFYLLNDGLQDQSVLLVSDDLGAEERVLLDPNTFSSDGTVSLSSYSVSPDGRKIAYSVSDGGTDWKTWKVRDVDSRDDLSDEIGRTKFTSAAWTPDSQGLYYSRYPRNESGEPDGSAAVRVFHHRLGDSQEDDTLVYENPDQPTWQPYPEATEDGRYLLINISEGYFSNAVLYRPMAESEAELTGLFTEWDALYILVGSRGSRLFFMTTKDAENSRLVSVDLEGGGELEEILPEAQQRLESVSLVGDRFVAIYLQDARSAVKIFDLDGTPIREIELPGLGTAGGFSGKADDPETFYSFSGFTFPNEIYRYDVVTGESSLFRAPKVNAELDSFETRQVFYDSRDGTKVPMFITHRHGIDLDGSHPTVLYGYGGFDISMTPGFRPDRLVWLEMGGILAIPNLRGGGEYGESWHRAGTKLQKQNVFDDFIAAAEYLIGKGYTSTEKLAIQGGSNGGLLVGAALNQRPDLFAAALPAVGVMDMLRYHLPSANARAWSSDYGLSENEDEFQALYAYSPYHNISDGPCYPPTWITTADHDDRVVPWHSFKYGARLQNAQGCDNPILVRVETRAGHGAGKPTWMRIEEVADRWAFLTEALEMGPADGD